MHVNIFQPKSNCWLVGKARRASFLIDGASYFQALHQAMQQARQSIIIVGWDLHSGLRLIRDGSAGDYPSTFGKFLEYLARKRKGLNIYLLSWDFAMIYAMEREFFPKYRLPWHTHGQIHFCLDGEHPVGGSQHQKVVVIDDAVAFAGGLDISRWRWDTSEHRADNALRVDPDGEAYPPFHDVQMLVDGEVASALGDLVRQRWQRACGELPPVPDPDNVKDLWPAGVKPDFEETTVAIARTMPQYKNYGEIREVERLYLDTISMARKSIYIENQYFSSYRVGEALKSRLTEEEGPEIVLVLPRKTGGWLEQHTMDVLRGRLLHTLRQADRYQRLQVYYPRVSIEPEVELMVHSKTMVIDDIFVRVGSSNLSNRSLGLDSECDLAIAATEGSEAALAISSFRNRLLAEHLGRSEQEVADTIAAHSSLTAAVEAMCGNERTLLPLQETLDEAIDELVPESKLLDPEKPIEPDEFVEYFLPSDQRRPAYHQFVKFAGLIATVLVFAVAWRWTPLGDYLNIETVTETASWLKAHRFGPVLVLLSYVVLGAVSFPVTLMIMATILVYGPWWGGWYAMLGALLSAVGMFGLGHLLGREIVGNMCGSLINRVNQRLAKSGVVAVIAFRVIPVAPFSVINLIAGVSAISFRDFVLGTCIGIIPGIVAISLTSDRLVASLRQPDLFNFSILIGVVAVLVAGVVGFRKWIGRKDSGDHSSEVS